MHVCTQTERKYLTPCLGRLTNSHRYDSRHMSCKGNYSVASPRHRAFDITVSRRRGIYYTPAVTLIVYIRALCLLRSLLVQKCSIMAHGCLARLPQNWPAGARQTANGAERSAPNVRPPAPSAANEDHESNLIHAKTIRGYPGVEPRQPTYVYVAAGGHRPLLPIRCYLLTCA
jgi:hypothetical protein